MPWVRQELTRFLYRELPAAMHAHTDAMKQAKLLVFLMHCSNPSRLHKSCRVTESSGSTWGQWTVCLVSTQLCRWVATGQGCTGNLKLLSTLLSIYLWKQPFCLFSALPSSSLSPPPLYPHHCTSFQAQLPFQISILFLWVCAEVRSYGPLPPTPD